MGKIKNSVIVAKKKKESIYNILFGCIAGLCLIASIVFFLLKIEDVGAIFIALAFLTGVVLIAINNSDSTNTSNNTEYIKTEEKSTDKVKLGKYYDPSIDYDALIQQAKDNKELDELEADWQTSIDYLREQIELFEGQVITAETEEDKLMIKARLQPMYEQLKVGESFIERFNAANNLPLLRELYHCGTFVSLEEAEKLRKKYDTILFSQTPDYKKLKHISNIAIIILDLFFVFLFITALGSIAESFDHTISFTHTFADTFGLGFGIFIFGSAVTLPVTGVVCFLLIPYVVHALVFEDGMSEADQKTDRDNAIMGITASAIAGGMIHHHIKKNKKK